MQRKAEKKGDKTKKQNTKSRNKVIQGNTNGEVWYKNDNYYKPIFTWLDQSINQKNNFVTHQ